MELPDGMLLPPFEYFGGKSRVASQIVRLLPDHEHYVEPFAVAFRCCWLNRRFCSRRSMTWMAT